MAIIMRGIEVANALKEKFLHEVEILNKKGITPGLRIIRLGARPNDISYERGAVKRCESVGIKPSVLELPEDISQNELIDYIKKTNEDVSIHGILLFRPLPSQIDENIIKHAIAPEKDVDCLSPINIAKVFEGDESGFAPCTPEAVMEVLDYYKVPITSKKAVIVGRSLVVGKPLSMLLLKKNATVTICHSRTENLPQVCRDAQILIAAVGKSEMIKSDFISEGCTVIDVGINVDESGNLHGDVDYQEAVKLAGLITPVPGGIGTVTSSVLAKHVIKAAKTAAGII